MPGRGRRRRPRRRARAAGWRPAPTSGSTKRSATRSAQRATTSVVVAGWWRGGRSGWSPCCESGSALDRASTALDAWTVDPADDDLLDVTDTEQLRALGHPARMRLLLSVGADGATVSQLSARLAPTRATSPTTSPCSSGPGWCAGAAPAPCAAAPSSTSSGWRAGSARRAARHPATPPRCCRPSPTRWMPPRATRCCTCGGCGCRPSRRRRWRRTSTGSSPTCRTGARPTRWSRCWSGSTGRAGALGSWRGPRLPRPPPPGVLRTAASRCAGG